MNLALAAIALRAVDAVRIVRAFAHLLDQAAKALVAAHLGEVGVEGLLAAVGSGRGKYCTSCYTGEYPVAFPRNEAAYLQLALKLVE